MKIYYDKHIELIFGLFYSAYKEGYVPENYGKYFFIESDFDYYRDFFILSPTIMIFLKKSFTFSKDFCS